MDNIHQNKKKLEEPVMNKNERKINLSRRSKSMNENLPLKNKKYSRSQCDMHR